MQVNAVLLELKVFLWPACVSAFSFVMVAFVLEVFILRPPL
jgi:hypothetical protein